MKSLIRLSLLALLISATTPRLMALEPILDYPQWQPGDAAVHLPQTAFHSWAEAEQEAQTLRKAWGAGQPVTMPWTAIQLDRYVKHKMAPSRAARGLALVHVAMHDALALAQQHQLDPQLAVSMAAAQVLAYLFPAEERAFDRIVYALAAEIHAAEPADLPEQLRQPLALGKAIGKRVVSRAQTDNAQYGWSGNRLQWYGEGRYYGPGHWQPTGPYFYYPPDEPWAPTWQPWLLSAPHQFRPEPPMYGSPQFVAELREVLDVAENLTEEQRQIAEHWVDGHGTVTPPGHWNQIAMRETLAAGLDDIAAARLFADLNITQADTFIAAWDSKYHYWTIRPVTAAKRFFDIDFKPAILTPPFPGYVSGHAATSGAGSEVLAGYFPERADTLRAMGEQAAMSRLYGGIHFRSDNEHGLLLGRDVARFVMRQLADKAPQD